MLHLWLPTRWHWRDKKPQFRSQPLPVHLAPRTRMQKRLHERTSAAPGVSVGKEGDNDEIGQIKQERCAQRREPGTSIQKHHIWSERHLAGESIQQGMQRIAL